MIISSGISIQGITKNILIMYDTTAAKTQKYIILTKSKNKGSRYSLKINTNTANTSRIPNPINTATDIPHLLKT